MRGQVLCAMGLLLIELAFSIPALQNPDHDPENNVFWCQKQGQARKSDPAIDAQTKACCEKVDKKFKTYMGPMNFTTTVGQEDEAHDFKDIYLEEVKPVCIFKSSPDTSWLSGLDECCETKGFALFGAGKWYRSR